MMKILIAIISFILGSIVTAAGSFLLWQQANPNSTEVWTTISEINLDRGIVIPQDIELIRERWMPEGFVTLKLYVNVEGGALDNFNQRTESSRNVVIPYWVMQ